MLLAHCQLGFLIFGDLFFWWGIGNLLLAASGVVGGRSQWT